MTCKPLLIAAAALCFATLPEAATIYRCGAAGNLYSDQPCIDGRIVAADDERSAAQRAEGLRVAALDRQLAHALQRERLLQESAVPKAAANIGPRPAAPVIRLIELPRHQRTAKHKGPRLIGREIDFVAYAPAPVKSTRR